MLASKLTKYEGKPYNLCIDCEHLGLRCDGPNFLAMEPDRLAEWCRLRKDYLHSLDPIWTNAYIAEQSGLSKASIDRFLSGKGGDIKVFTAAQLIRTLINGTWGQYPCAMDAFSSTDSVLLQRVTTAETECRQLIAVSRETSKQLEFLSEQIKMKDEQIREKNIHMSERADFLRRKDRAIRILIALFGLSLLLIFLALIIDRLNPDIGFFWFK